MEDQENADNVAEKDQCDMKQILPTTGVGRHSSLPI